MNRIIPPHRNPVAPDDGDIYALRAELLTQAKRRRAILNACVLGGLVALVAIAVFVR